MQQTHIMYVCFRGFQLFNFAVGNSPWILFYRNELKEAHSILSFFKTFQKCCPLFWSRIRQIKSLFFLYRVIPMYSQSCSRILELYGIFHPGFFHESWLKVSDPSSHFNLFQGLRRLKSQKKNRNIFIFQK